MFSACGLRLRVIHAFFDGERVVLRFTPFYDFLRVARTKPPDTLQLLMRYLVGHAVGDVSMTPRPLALPGPMPELEQGWARAGKLGKRAQEQLLKRENKNRGVEAKGKRAKTVKKPADNPAKNGDGKVGKKAALKQAKKEKAKSIVVVANINGGAGDAAVAE